MALISGTLKNASGVRPNTKIILKSIKSTIDVLNHAPDYTVVTDSDGKYSFECAPSLYSVTISQSGMPRESVGIIHVYYDTAATDINHLIVCPVEDLTPEIVKACLAAEKSAADSAAKAESAANTAATDAADKFSQEFQDRFNTLQPIPWEPNKLVDNSLQVYSYNGSNYLPKKTVPFTTGATFNADNWVLSELATVDFVTKINGTLTDIVNITSDTHIPNTAKLHIPLGAGFNVSSGVTLTIDASIAAGHYQIFFGDGEVLTSQQLPKTPKSLRHRVKKVKAAWFGVVNDAALAESWSDGGSPVVSGQLPTGTDSTEALKRAAKMAQYGSLAGGRFLGIDRRLPLELEPNSTIFVRGNNIFGEQIHLADLSAIAAEAAVSGGNFKNLEAYKRVNLLNFNFSVIGNYAEILWSPDGELNQFFSVKQIMHNLTVDKLNIVPCGFATNKYGILLRNEGLTQKDGDPSIGYFNNLNYQEFKEFKCTSGELQPPQSSMSYENGLKWHYSYLGYSLGDRLHCDNCSFTHVNTLIYNQNPEAVETYFKDCELSSGIDDAVFFDYLSYFGSFNWVRGGIFMKGNNQTLLRTSVVAGVSSIVNSAEFAFRDFRMEGYTGYKKTLVVAEYGKINFENFTSSYAMANGEEYTSVAAEIGKFASVHFKDCSIPSIVKINDDIEVSQVVSRPILSLTGCSMNFSDGIDLVTYGGNSYKYAVSTGKKVPRIEIINQRPATTGYVLPPPDYGNTGSNGGRKTNCCVMKRDSSGYERINGEEFNLPLFILIDSAVVHAGGMPSNYKKIKMTIGSVSVDVGLPATKQRLELLSNKRIIVNTNDVSKVRFDYIDETGSPISGGSPALCELSYRSIQGKSECPNNGESNVFLI